MRRLALVVVVAVVFGACYGDDEPEPAFDTATAVIETESGPVMFTVEVAETDEQRQMGLMGRERMPEDHGMVFMYFEEHAGSFWMKDTLIPLSIAFFDVDGKILEILDMEPCRTDPCPIYSPGIEFIGALEVNQGAFDRLGVAEGDVIHIAR